MTLAHKSETEYVELIDGYLDQFHSETGKDCTLVAEALKSVIDSSQPHEVADDLKDRIEEIKILLARPEMFAAKEDLTEFKEIVTSRIKDKIANLEEGGTEEGAHEMGSGDSEDLVEEWNKLLEAVPKIGAQLYSDAIEIAKKGAASSSADEATTTSSTEGKATGGTDFFSEIIEMFPGAGELVSKIKSGLTPEQQEALKKLERLVGGTSDEEHPSGSSKS